MNDRKVTMKGKPVELEGTPIAVGDDAPGFTAVDTDLDTVDCMGRDVEGKVELIVAVPSLDTSVCSIESKRFNDEAAKLGDKVRVTILSMDLPFAQKRWADENDIDNLRLASDYRDRRFGQAYGVLMSDLKLLARSIFVIGKDGKVSYVQIVDEVTDEPDYDEALAAARAAAGI
jgi:thiol peroxidase